MRADHEELVLRNPALGACVFWHFSRTFSEYASGRAPELPYFVVTIGMIFHQGTVEKVHRMYFDSGILKAISERPDIVAGLQGRVEEYFPLALRALQVGATGGILLEERGRGFPTFRAKGNDLPVAIRHGEASVPRIFSCAKRLGAWFAHEPIEVLQRHLHIEF